MHSIDHFKALRTIALLTALLEVIACAACVPGNGDTAAVRTEAPDVTLSADARPLAYDEVFEPSTDFDNRFGRGFADVMVTEDAYYLGLGGEYYIYYYDKQTREYGVLCGKPDCIHDADPSGSNTECGGFIGCIGENKISIMGSRIYYIGETDRQTSDIGCALFSMALDGSDHRKLFPLNCGDRYAPARLEVHRGKAYGTNCFYSIDQGEPHSVYTVSCWDIETGEFKVVYDRELRGDKVSTPWPCLFYFGQYVYIMDSYRVQKDQQTSESTVKIFRWNSVSEELETVFDSQDDGLPGFNYTMWVEAEDRIILTPTYTEEPIHPVFIIEDGRPVELFSVNEGLSAFLVDGLFVGFYFGREREKHIHITDFDGHTVYEGLWVLDYVEGAQPDDYSINAVFGDMSKIVFVYGIHSMSLEKSVYCAVSYDLCKDEPVPEKLCIVEEP